MTTATAKLNHLNIAPRKVRLIVNTLKGLTAAEAEAQLYLRPQRSAGPLLKLLRSAVANARDRKLTPERLMIKEIKVDGGPVLKRSLPRAMGRVTPILKRTSHITLVLMESDKALPARFIFVKKERAKKPKKTKEAKKKIEPAVKKEEKIEERPGFFKRIFRRKAI